MQEDELGFGKCMQRCCRLTGGGRTQGWAGLAVRGLLLLQGDRPALADQVPRRPARPARGGNLKGTTPLEWPRAGGHLRG